MNLPMVDRIVNALLYEGYILYPYRASALKNQLRFNFGVVYPRAYAEAQSGSDAWTMQTECLADGGPGASLEIRVRFLRVVERVVGEGGEPGGLLFARPVLFVWTDTFTRIGRKRSNAAWISRLVGSLRS